jgi:hypothetical protein
LVGPNGDSDRLESALINFLPKVDLEILHFSAVKHLGRVDAGLVAKVGSLAPAAFTMRTTQTATLETFGQLDTSLGPYALAFILIQFVGSSKNSRIQRYHAISTLPASTIYLESRGNVELPRIRLLHGNK